MVQIFGLIDYCLIAHNPSIIVDKDVSHDSEYPALKIYIVNVFVFVVKSFQGCVLK